MSTIPSAFDARLTIATFLAVLWLPLLVAALRPDADLSLTEQRTLAAAPGWPRDAAALVNLTDDNHHTALMVAAALGHAEAVAALLAIRGVDTATADASGHTALMLAIQRGHDDIVDALLAADAGYFAYIAIEPQRVIAHQFDHRLAFSRWLGDTRAALAERSAETGARSCRATS